MFRTFNRFAFFVLILFSPLFLSPSANSFQAQDVSAQFEDLWIDYNVRQDNKLGMLIHTKFSVQQMNGLDGYLTIRILDENDEALKSSNTNFRNKNGDLAIYKSFKPSYDDAVYNDWEVFLPYSEIELGGGVHKLKIDADLIYQDGTLIKHLTLHNFEYTGQDRTNSTQKQVSAEFKKMWIDYDVSQNGQFGMLMHVDFSVLNLKDKSGQLAFGLELENGDKVYANSQDYSSTNGQLTVYRTLNIEYDNSVFTDVTVFLPYREITVGTGSHDLRIHLDLIYDNEGNQHLTYHSFNFTK